MARLIYAAQAFADLDRLADFLIEVDPVAAGETLNLIAEAVEVLRNHPLIGRRVEHDLRELVISRGQSGYIALYRYHAKEEVVMLLALRHQREAGYTARE